MLVYLGPARGTEAARRDAGFFKVCGITRQVGVPLTEDMQAHRQNESDDSLEPEFQRLARNLAELGDARTDSPEAWDLRLTQEEHARAAEALAPAAERPVLAVSVGTKVQSKDWGRENWRELLGELGERYGDYALALMGAPEESEASEYAAEGWRQATGSDALVVNLCGKLTPRESAACFARAKLFLGHDSGPMHLAATVGTTCVAIFAARNIPRVWYPHGKHHRVVYHKVDCMGCGLETCIVQKKKCLTSISVDEVAGEVIAVLG